MSDANDGVNLTVPPSGPGCVDCEPLQSWWFHLRRCAECGHVGCCDSSPNQHATAHWKESGHPIMRSYEPGEVWFWDYVSEDYYDGPDLAHPLAHPEDQPVPGPEGRVPDNWKQLLIR